MWKEKRYHDESTLLLYVVCQTCTLSVTMDLEATGSVLLISLQGYAHYWSATDKKDEGNSTSGMFHGEAQYGEAV